MTPRAIAGLFLAVPTAVSAALIHVPSECPTIEAGLAAAVAGDVVEVACGTYYEHDLVLPMGVALVSETRQASCVTIDASGLGRVLNCEGNSVKSEIEGITVARGLVAADSSGAGIDAREAWLVVRACRFVDNWYVPAQYGGGSGGGIRAQSSTLDVSGSVFEGNYVHGVGGGICVEASSVASVSDTQFLDNHAIGGGGAFARYSSLTVSNCAFQNNGAGGHDGGTGGGLGSWQSSLVVTGCTLVANNAGVSGGGGGGIAHADGDCDISSCLFARNTTSGAADALLLGGTVTGHVAGCTFVRNGLYASDQLATVVCWGGGVSVGFQQCLMAFNAPSSLLLVKGAAASIACTDIYGNGQDWSPDIVDQANINGNFSADPLFCDLEQNDFHLQWGSPCLPANSSGCDLGGALGLGECGSAAVEPESWAEVKARYR